MPQGVFPPHIVFAPALPFGRAFRSKLPLVPRGRLSTAIPHAKRACPFPTTLPMVCVLTNHQNNPPRSHTPHPHTISLPSSVKPPPFLCDKSSSLPHSAPEHNISPFLCDKSSSLPHSAPEHNISPSLCDKSPSLPHSAPAPFYPSPPPSALGPIFPLHPHSFSVLC